MEKSTVDHEVDAILEKIGDAELRGITSTERRSAVGRTVKFLGLSSNKEVHQLIEIIETHEAQLNVHTGPSDPNDLDD